MSTEDNKRVAREVWGALSSGDFAKMASLYHADVAYHGAGGEERRGRDAAIDLARMYKTAFSDMKADVEQLVAEGDFVVSRVRPSGTHTGDLMGMAPTGKKIDLRWVMNMVRVVDGKVAEEWEIWDNADLMRQLGVSG